MKFILPVVVLVLSIALGCSGKTEAPVDSPELREQQAKSQQQADMDEVQYQKGQKKKK